MPDFESIIAGLVDAHLEVGTKVIVFTDIALPVGHEFAIDVILHRAGNFDAIFWPIILGVLNHDFEVDPLIQWHLGEWSLMDHLNASERVRVLWPCDTCLHLRPFIGRECAGIILECGAEVAIRHADGADRSTG